MVVVTPYFVVEDYNFRDWLYRGLVFLVISCPCALVVSIPLGYFGGIGLASRNGILFKGANFLDIMTKVDTVVMDKTGTLTKGVFKVQKVVTTGISESEFLQYLASIESKSSHPIARAVVEYTAANASNLPVKGLEEIPGYGLKAIINDKQVLAGNTKLLRKFEIPYDEALGDFTETVIVMAINNTYAGYILIADEVKSDAAAAVKALQKAKIKVVMLSGDKLSVVKRVAESLGIPEYAGDLLPEQKVAEVARLKEQGRTIAFVGDGVNDAPAIALADAGISMGGLGSDAAIEISDIVIQNDQPSKIATIIRIGSITRNIVWQNICLAMGVKIIVLILGAGGLANLWEAVIADVGVALLAILNAVRIQKFKV
jgi:Cd2+/Zn2+-exporting ATPase